MATGAALTGSAAAFAWAPRGLSPRLGGRECAAVTLALAAVGGVAWSLAPGEASARAALAGLVQVAAATVWLDLRLRLIADLYSLAVALAAVAGGLAPGWPAALAGAGVGAGLLAGVRALVGARLGREAMGWGDVKLAAALGLVLGPLPLLWTVAVAAAAGAAAGLLAGRGGGEPRIPFGALLAPAGAAAAWLARGS